MSVSSFWPFPPPPLVSIIDGHQGHHQWIGEIVGGGSGRIDGSVTTMATCRLQLLLSNNVPSSDNVIIGD